VSDADHPPKLLTHHACQQINALDHSLQIMLRWAIEQTNLYIYDKAAGACDIEGGLLERSGWHLMGTARMGTILKPLW
jgi:hypothetical protein